MVSRIAPTPSGYLHLGNAFNFLLTWLLVRSAEGRLLLRIDDMDRSRLRPEYLSDIFTLIEWLGLDYDDGPAGPDDFDRDWSQRHRLVLYREMLDHLASQQSLAGHPLFFCECSRAKILQDTAGSELPGVYPGTCRANYLDTGNLAEGLAVRINTTAAGAASWKDGFLGLLELPIEGKLKDFVVWKKDACPAYQLSSLVDDLHFGVDTIVRGEDLLESTAAQLFLADRIGAVGEPFSASKFFHHPLIPSDSGTKLSKSAGAGSVSLIKQGHSAAEVIAAFCRWIGMKEVRDTAELLQQSRELGSEFLPQFNQSSNI